MHRNIVLQEVLKAEGYAPHLETAVNAIRDDTLYISLSFPNSAIGWVKVALEDGTWVSQVYAGETEDTSDFVFLRSLQEETYSNIRDYLHNERVESNKIAILLDLPQKEEGVPNPADVMKEWLEQVLVESIASLRYRTTLLNRIPSLVLTSAGGVAPFQVEGTLDGYPFYFRYRNGKARLTVPDPESRSREPLYIASVEYGNVLDGALSVDEFAQLFIRLVQILERSPQNKGADKDTGFNPAIF